MTLVADDADAGTDEHMTAGEGCGRANSPLWMAEWCYYQAVMDTGLFCGPLERAELSGRLAQDRRLRAIDDLVTALASRLAARLHPGAWAARDERGARRAATYKCADCGDAVSRRKNMPPDTDGKIRCGRCKNHLTRYGGPRPAVRARHYRTAANA